MRGKTLGAPVVGQAQEQADADGAGSSQHVVIMLQRILVEDAHRVLDGPRADAVLAVVEGKNAHHLPVFNTCRRSGFAAFSRIAGNVVN